MRIFHVIYMGSISELFEDKQEAKRYVKGMVERRELDDDRDIEIQEWGVNGECK